MTQDPFAEAAVATADPYTATGDLDDPFATSSDYRGGDFTPAVPLENLQGRVVVMIPRSLDPNSKDPNDPTGQKTREQYTVDLHVLTGGRLSYYYTERANAEKGTPEQTKEMVFEDVSPATPATWLNYWVPQQGLIGKLKKAHANGRPFLGMVAMVPTAADRKSGKTAAQVQAEVTAWVARARQGARPRYTWALEDPTPEQRAIAVQWWKDNRESIPAITPA
jgi:hypothetical protein